MKFISHRRNTISQLIATDTNNGVEVDIRSNDNKLIIHHDPFADGEDFERWLSFYKHDTLILNVKEEGLEDKILALLNKFNINNFFFLDQSFPFLIKFAQRGESRSAVRFSEYESIETVLSLSNKVDWVWVDCFNFFPMKKSDYLSLKKANFKLCLVSPELQGRKNEDEILNLFNFLHKNEIFIDAVCTKNVDFWKKLESDYERIN